MINVVDMYCNFIINPIEKQIKELQTKIRSKNFFDFISRSLYKKQLKKMEKLLLEKYKKLEAIIQEETNFNNEIQKKIKSMRLSDN